MPTYVVNLTPEGAAGSATATVDSDPIEGLLNHIYVDFTSEPATTDVTVTELYAPYRAILTLTNVNTDTLRYPTVKAQDLAGVAQSADLRLHISGRLRVVVAQGDPVANGVRVYFGVTDL